MVFFSPERVSSTKAELSLLVAFEMFRLHLSTSLCHQWPAWLFSLFGGEFGRLIRLGFPFAADSDSMSVITAGL